MGWQTVNYLNRLPFFVIKFIHMKYINKITNANSYLCEFDLDAQMNALKIIAKPWSQSKPWGDDRWGVSYSIESDLLLDPYFVLEDFLDISVNEWSDSGYKSGYDEIKDLKNVVDPAVVRIKNDLIKRVKANYSFEIHSKLLIAVNELSADCLEALNAIYEFAKYHPFTTNVVRLLPSQRFRLYNTVQSPLNNIQSMSIISFVGVCNNEVFNRFLPEFFTEKVKVEMSLCKKCKLIEKAKEDGWRIIVIDQTSTYKTFDFTLSKTFDKEQVLGFISHNTLSVPCYYPSDI